MSEYKEDIAVTMTVTVSMTPAQQEAYFAITGAGFVGQDVTGRIRREAGEALNLISWLRECASVTISKPVGAVRKRPVANATQLIREVHGGGECDCPVTGPGYTDEPPF